MNYVYLVLQRIVMVVQEQNLWYYLMKCVLMAGVFVLFLFFFCSFFLPSTSVRGVLVDKTPILAFINTKSGAAQGEEVFKGLSRYLNRAQIRDLGVDKV